MKHASLQIAFDCVDKSRNDETCDIAHIIDAMLRATFDNVRCVERRDDIMTFDVVLRE